VYQQFGYAQISSAALTAHEQLYLDITIPTGGYLYTYVASESKVSNATSVYGACPAKGGDDFNIIHTRNTNTLQVLQTSDYYPFGLPMAAQGYQTQSSLDNDYLYNGKELQDEHNLGWMDYGARMYMSDIGRWNGIDIMASKYNGSTPYNYTLNNPIIFIDPDGRKVVYIGSREFKSEMRSIFKQLGKMSSNFKDDLRQLKKSDHIHTIKEIKKGNSKDPMDIEKRNELLRKSISGEISQQEWNSETHVTSNPSVISDSEKNAWRLGGSDDGKASTPGVGSNTTFYISLSELPTDFNSPTGKSTSVWGAVAHEISHMSDDDRGLSQPANDSNKSKDENRAVKKENDVTDQINAFLKKNGVSFQFQKRESY